MTTPSTFAREIAAQLADVLCKLHAHYVDAVQPAQAIAVEHRDFGPAREICADSEFVLTEVDRVVRSSSAVAFRDRGIHNSSDGLCDLVLGLVNSGPLDVVLEDLDPERLANDDRVAASLRVSGNWSDADEADRQIDMAERRAAYPAPKVPQ